MIQFFVAGAPVGKGRPRFSKASGRAFTPQKTANAEAFVKSEALRLVGQPVLIGPLELQLIATAVVPDSWPEKKRADALAGRLWPVGKPDLDNLGKLYADALNGILWKDDSQLVRMALEKRYGEIPGVLITVLPIDDTVRESPAADAMLDSERGFVPVARPAPEPFDIFA